MDIQKSDLVMSLNGRDAGKIMIVLGIFDDYVLLADGKGRRTESPKRKKKKHLKFVSKNDGCVAAKIRNNEKVSNSEIRRVLAEFSVGVPEGEGGM